MIAWIRRASALSAGLLFCARFFPQGMLAAAIIALAAALAWSLDGLFPKRIRKPANSAFLAINAFLVAWAALAGAFAWWLIVAVSLSLICWNAGDFLARWRDPPAAFRARYVESLAFTAGVGAAAALSAVFLSGKLSLGFAATLVLMLLSGVTVLRVFRKYR